MYFDVPENPCLRSLDSIKHDYFEKVSNQSLRYGRSTWGPYQSYEKIIQVVKHSNNIIMATIMFIQ